MYHLIDEMDLSKCESLRYLKQECMITDESNINVFQVDKSINMNGKAQILNKEFAILFILFLA